MSFHELITGAVVATTNMVFGPITVFQPIISLSILSVVLTLVVLFVGRLVTNKKFISEIKTRLEDLRVKLAQAQKEGNNETVKQLMNEFMKVNGQYMKHSFKMLIISLIVISVFLPWASHTYEGKAVATLPFSAPFIGTNLSWIYWYILTSFTAGWIIRKLFGFE